MSSEPPSKKSKMASSSENPYLAHKLDNGNGSSNGYSNGGASTTGVGAAGSSKSPLNGLVPRKVSVAQAKGIMVSR